MNAKPEYRRVMLKLSGEALMGPSDFGLHQETVDAITNAIIDISKAGISVAIVVGAGNIFRGVSGAAAGMARAQADQMGMLATVMNALALEDILTKKGLDTRAMSAVPINGVCEPFGRKPALAHLAAGRAVICAGGTGNPFFTTDTAAALRAVELECDVLLKATQVDGVYSDDPKTNPDATRYENLSYDEVLAKNLQVMDAAAISIARENALPVIIASIQDPATMLSVLCGQGRFTIIGK
ncbi:MAG: UMP kinase [Rhizobiales bacterium]|nr:UMP kinase [Hyphomicrobiales bacterium]